MLKKFYQVINQDKKNIILTIIAILLIIMSTLKAYHYTKEYGGGELKRRIVGARLLNTNKSPYQYNWQKGDSLAYFVSNMEHPVSGNGLTVTPGTLYLLNPLSKLSYDKIRFVWSFIQLALFFGTVMLIIKSGKKTITIKEQIQILIVALLFYVSPLWLMNIEKGQIYILYAFIFSLMHYLYNKSENKLAQFSLGLLLIFAVWLRPIYLVASTPVLLSKSKYAFLGMLLCGLLLSLVTYLDWGLWQSYLTAIDFYTTFNYDGTPPEFIINTPVENLMNYDKFKSDWQVYGINPIGYYITALCKIVISNKIYTVIAILISVAVSLKALKINKSQAILSSFLCYLIYELIIPSPRGPYNLIIWLYPMLYIGGKKLDNKTMVLGVVSFCLTQGWPFYFPYLGFIGEIIFIYILCWLIFYRKEITNYHA
jgi:hypothetical protein